MNDFSGTEVVEIEKGKYRVKSVEGDCELDVSYATKTLRQFVQNEVSATVSGLSFLATVIERAAKREDDLYAYDLHGLAAILNVLSTRLDGEAHGQVGAMAVLQHFCSEDKDR